MIFFGSRHKCLNNREFVKKFYGVSDFFQKVIDIFIHKKVHQFSDLDKTFNFDWFLS